MIQRVLDETADKQRSSTSMRFFARPMPFATRSMLCGIQT
jgi:hypothetical protein